MNRIFGETGEIGAEERVVGVVDEAAVVVVVVIAAAVIVMVVVVVGVEVVRRGVSGCRVGGERVTIVVSGRRRSSSRCRWPLLRRR